MDYFSHKTKFLRPQCKFWVGFSALLFCTVELSDGNNEAEHKNIMIFGRGLFLQCERHVPLTDQARLGILLVKCHQINGISSNWQNNEGVCSSTYLEGSFSKAEWRHITRAPAGPEKTCWAVQTQYLKAKGLHTNTQGNSTQSLAEHLHLSKYIS